MDKEQLTDLQKAAVLTVAAQRWADESPTVMRSKEARRIGREMARTGDRELARLFDILRADFAAIEGN